MFESNILIYVWKSYERLSSLYYEILAFDTAKTYLDKAEEIVEANYEPCEYEFLDFKKKKSLYFKKF